jgi:hypothetical protein
MSAAAQSLQIRRLVNTSPAREAVLQVGDCRITITPFGREPARSSAPFSQRLLDKSADSTPAEWQAAEAEVQSRTNMPFEMPGAVRTERISLVPRAGATYRALTGADVEIARVVGRDGLLWAAIDVNEKPVVLKRVELRWHALPPSAREPMPGQPILHGGVESIVKDVLGEAEVGGWAVLNDQDVPLHVICGESNHWVSLGAIEL